MPCPTLGNNSAEQTCGAGHRQQRGDAKGASRLAENGDVIRVAAEGSNVVLHPCEGGNLVEHTKVSDTVIQVEETVCSEAIIDCDTYYSITSEAAAIILWYCA